MGSEFEIGRCIERLEREMSELRALVATHEHHSPPPVNVTPEVVADVGMAPVAAVTDTAGGIGEGAEDVLEELSDSLLELTEAVVDAADVPVEVAEDIAEDVGEATEAVLEAEADTTTDALEAAVDAVEDATEAVVKVGRDVAPKREHFLNRRLF